MTVDDGRGLDERRMLPTKLHFGFIDQFQATAVTVDDDRGLYEGRMLPIKLLRNFSSALLVSFTERL